jgi:hypothetical protein
MASLEKRAWLFLKWSKMVLIPFCIVELWTCLMSVFWLCFSEGKPKFFARPCGIAAIFFATALPFYLMLKDSKVS